MKIVSACLAGVNCRFDGKSKPNPKVVQMIKEGKAIPVCPEQLGGLPTPREISEIKDGLVVTVSGRDVTKQVIRGAEETLKLAKLVGATEAILKARSPSCGKGKICDGTFSGKLVQGNGFTAELLLKHGIKVITEEELR